jgi:predicted nucleotidyltransferase
MGTIDTSSNVLFTKVQQLVLKLLYLNPHSDFNTNEIIRLTKSGTGSVQRELEKLTTARLITAKKLANQKRYQANQNLSYYSELRSIVIKTFGLADVLSEQLKLSLAARIKIAFIYGSFAKQTDTQISDIDLMLIGDDLTYVDIFKMLKEAEISLGHKINPSCYTPLEWKQKYRKENHFIQQVIEQPKIFLIGTEDELKKLR